MLEELWKLAASGKLLLWAGETIKGDSGVEASPFGLPRARNYERTVSADARLISDITRANLGFDKSKLYPT